jgi:transcriptional regulator with GAF, ATPase, and Fis domain
VELTAAILGLTFDLLGHPESAIEPSPGPSESAPGIVGRSEALRAVLHTVARVAPLDSSVLLQGESGTGKELIARALHRQSARAAGPFEAISCPSIPRDLIEAEFFGHEKGAFTGADRERPGRFELADGGTLFLDEIGDIEPGTQSKLLRVLQEREFQRVGGRHPIHVDVRVIAATSRDLFEEMRAGRFREDLYYRLSVVPIAMPALRERGEDVLLLADHFLTEFAAKSGAAPARIAADAREILLRYPWPGNVRELRNLLEYLVAMNREGRITAADLPARIREAAEAASPVDETESAGLLKPGETLDARLMAVEGQLIRRALVLSGWNQSQAARLLGMTETRMRHRMRRYGAQSQDGSGKRSRPRKSKKPRR